jgi:hypothetical protein
MVDSSHNVTTLAVTPIFWDEGKLTRFNCQLVLRRDTSHNCQLSELEKIFPFLVIKEGKVSVIYARQHGGRYICIIP